MSRPILILLLCIVPSVLIGQPQSDCPKRIKVMIDDMTGDTNWFAKKDIWVPAGPKKEGFRVLLWRHAPFENDFDLNGNKLGAGIMLAFFVEGRTACIDEDADANFLFKDGQRFVLEHSGNWNCDGVWRFRFDPNFSDDFDFKKLLDTTSLAKVRISLSKGWIEGSLTSKQAKEFSDLFHCLSMR